MWVQSSRADIVGRIWMLLGSKNRRRASILLVLCRPDHPTDESKDRYVRSDEEPGRCCPEVVRSPSRELRPLFKNM
jgi:hypothetical protein